MKIEEKLISQSLSKISVDATFNTYFLLVHLFSQHIVLLVYELMDLFYPFEIRHEIQIC
jgi:hypothetical protein